MIDCKSIYLINNSSRHNARNSLILEMYLVCLICFIASGPIRRRCKQPETLAIKAAPAEHAHQTQQAC